MTTDDVGLSWIRKNLPTLVMIGTLFAGLVTNTVEQKMIKIQVEDHEARLRAHMGNSAIHLDPIRDERQWQEWRQQINDITRELRELTREVRSKGYR